MDRQALIDYFRHLDRALFLDPVMKQMANFDEPLPIGHGQTISQPTLVLEMTLQLDPLPDSRVLEIGTGSGYQTALLAAFSQQVYTIERIADLASEARKRLDHLGFSNIQYRLGDGSSGWPDESPFDRIIVTAAASVVPPPLIDQLATGGRMIIPVGPRGWQDLLLITRDQDGQVRQSVIEKVSFVELVSPYGWHP